MNGKSKTENAATSQEKKYIGLMSNTAIIEK